MKPEILAIELRLRLKKAAFRLRRGLPQKSRQTRRQTIVPFHELGRHHDVFFSIMVLWTFYQESM